MYTLAALYPNALFRQISEGNTRASCDISFPADGAWDALTGLGLPKWDGFLKYLADDSFLEELRILNDNKLESMNKKTTNSTTSSVKDSTQPTIENEGSFYLRLKLKKIPFLIWTGTVFIVASIIGGNLMIRSNTFRLKDEHS